MLKQLLYKWFGLTDAPCETCEILRLQLDESNRERRELLHRLLDKDKPEPPSVSSEEPVPITPNFVPWRVRQQMLEQEDRVKANILKKHAQSVEELEKELGVAHDVSGSSGGVAFSGVK